MSQRDDIVEAGAKGVFQGRERRLGVTTQEIRFPNAQDRLDADAALTAMLPLIAEFIRAMGHESWDGYTPDEVPDQIAARLIEGWTP